MQRLVRSDLTLPPTTPHGDITNNRRPPPPQHPSDDSPSPTHDTADPPDSFHFFWNYSSVFSQWYLWCDIEYEGITYNCAEQMMMAQKAALFGDTATELRIRTTPDPADQKSLGRTVSGFDQECWEPHRYDIVLNTNFRKFSQNPDLQQVL